MSDFIRRKISTPKPTNVSQIRMGNSVDIALIGDLTVSDIRKQGISAKGSETLDILSWIPQVGSSR